MSLVEMAIVGLVGGVVLFLLNGWMTTLREQTKRDLAIRLLTDLDQALARYHRACGVYPVSYGQDSAIPATVDLLDHDKTRPLLEALPPSLWRGPGRRNLVDPWGTPLRYYDSPEDSPLVKANDGHPLFMSAGPDRDFGDRDGSRVGDNLRSDDPGPSGFRLHNVMRASFTEQEKESGKAEH
jgi:type II secretory pathway pseudopilin PulG